MCSHYFLYKVLRFKTFGNNRLQVERERGITVKAQSASIIYNYKGIDYLLNLIDTPGHVDFSNEVSRSLAACQGVILLVDANQVIYLPNFCSCSM